MGDIKVLKDRIAQLEAELEERYGTIVDLEATVADLSGDVADLTEERNHRVAELELLVEYLEEQVDGLESDVDYYKDELEDSQAGSIPQELIDELILTIQRDPVLHFLFTTLGAPGTTTYEPLWERLVTWSTFRLAEARMALFPDEERIHKNTTPFGE